MYLLNSSNQITLGKGFPGILAVLLVASVSCRSDHIPRILIETDLGAVTLEIYPEKAPVTANNFLQLVEQGVYSNAMFYRVVRPDNQPANPVKIEVIQGGLLEDSLIDRFNTIPHEITSETGIRHEDGVISMARNGPGTASTEFFICIGDQPSLDYGGNRNPDGQGFAAFGRVTSGMDVVRAIQQLPDTAQMLLDPVRIRQIKIVH
jgi:peptidyl-prolyl cis-trans isomerase A (cyclophilin A)